MEKKWERSSEELVSYFYECMEKFARAELRKMFGYPCCFVNNNMFTGLHEQNWVVRLPEHDRNELIDSHGATPFVPMEGKPMREYVALPLSIRNDQGLLKKWIQKSLDYALSLPPKEKKRPKRAKVKGVR